jgi:hypothetical protein
MSLSGVARFGVVAAFVCLIDVRPTDARSQGPSLFGDAGLVVPPRDPRDRPWGVSLYGGAGASGRMLDILTSPWDSNLGSYAFVGGALSRRIVRFWSDFEISAEFGSGYRFSPTNSFELWAALYLRFDGFPWNDYLYTSIGVSTGVDYVMRLPEAEVNGGGTSEWLHYFSPEIAVALPAHPEHQLVLRLHHRSGVFGVFNGVHGGSNVLALGYRYRF